MNLLGGFLTVLQIMQFRDASPSESLSLSTITCVPFKRVEALLRAWSLIR